MAKLTINDLEKIKKNAVEQSLRQADANIKVTVHMGTCGIAAGARDVLNALMAEIAAANRHDIQVLTSGCIGNCRQEPNVTVEINGAKPIVYEQMNPAKMRQVIQRYF